MPDDDQGKEGPGRSFTLTTSSKATRADSLTTPRCSDYEATIDGGPGNDYITGNSGDDRLIGGPGNDGITGMNGDDRLIGGPGSDGVDGKKGRDVCQGETIRNCEKRI